MATYCIPRDPLTWFVVGVRRVLLSACTVALVSCGGGQGGPAAPVDSVGPTRGAHACTGRHSPPAPAQLVVGTAQSIDGGASGTPVNLRVARSANGDGFAVWRADNGELFPAAGVITTSGPTTTAPRRPRGAARSGSWRAALRSRSSILRSTPVATRWSHGTRFRILLTMTAGAVMSARFDTGAGAWGTPVPLNTAAAVPARCQRCHRCRARRVRRLHSPSFRVFAGASSIPPVALGSRKLRSSRTTAALASSFDPEALLDGSGNAFVAFGIERFF